MTKHTITKEEEINREVILEIVKKKRLQSAFLFKSPRVYVKLKLFRELVKEGKLKPYHREEYKDRVWEFYR